MSAMHHDTSSDLKVVRDILKNVLEVYLTFHVIWSFSSCLTLLFAFISP